MRHTKIMILNPEAIETTKKLACLAARITQHGEKISTFDDVDRLSSVSDNLIKKLVDLPHKNLFKHTMISVIVIGASSRFLMQITRHQDGVNFTSASCQYSDYSNDADFMVPISVEENHNRFSYITSCKHALNDYKELVKLVGRDDASYLLPKALRNVLLISATPAEWQHIISQRICKRNTAEMRYIMLKIAIAFNEIAPELFNQITCGPFCQSEGHCKEKSFCCGNSYSATDDFKSILRREFNEDV